MAKSIFVTATGTDIGKTYISGLIVKKMREFGFNCGYFKPVLSGLVKDSKGNYIPEDCNHVIKTSGLNIEPMDCLSYAFKDAVSPHLASDRAGIKIDVNKILCDYKNLSKNYEYMVIEGAGGITCPIIINDSKTYLMSDLIKDMNQNVIIIADGGLGTINSVLTTVEYINNRNIPIKGIVLNNYDKTDFMHKNNYSMIEKLTNIEIIGTVAKNCTNFDIEKNKLEGLFK